MTRKRNEFGGSERKKGMGLYTLIAIMILVLGLLFAVSMSNYSTYELVSQGGTITLWKGKFIPKGPEPVQSFDTLEGGDMAVGKLTGKSYSGRNAAQKAVFLNLMDLIAAELAKGNDADLTKLEDLLDRADELLPPGKKRDMGLLGSRFQLAKTRVAVAEMSLERAYQKALPIYDEAIKSGMGDRESLEIKRDTMEAALASAPY
jgi:hypothetical protein